MNSLEILIKPWTQASQEAFRIRKAVFIDEQGVPEEMELDEFDAAADHVLAFLGNQCVGTARLVDSGLQSFQIGRMAVLANFRGQGIGLEILKALIDRAKSLGASTLNLHAQVSAIPFYEKLGFLVQGPMYEEAGIPHRNMMLILPKSI